MPTCEAPALAFAEREARVGSRAGARVSSESGVRTSGVITDPQLGEAASRFVGGCRPRGGQLDGIHDVLVPGASAEISGNGLTNLHPGRMWLLAKESGEGHQETRRAKTTLECVSIPEGFLKRRESSVRLGQGLDGLKFVAIGLDGKHNARAHRFPIEEDGAGPAHAVFTTDVGAGEAKVLAEEIAQQQARFHLAFMLGPVDKDGKAQAGPDGCRLSIQRHRCRSWARV